MWWQARVEGDILWRGTWLSTHFSWMAQSSIRGIWIVEDSGLDCWTNEWWSNFVLLKLSIHTHSGTNILSSLCPMRIMYEIFFLNMLELSRTWWIWVKTNSFLSVNVNQEETLSEDTILDLTKHRDEIKHRKGKQGRSKGKKGQVKRTLVQLLRLCLGLSFDFFFQS